MRDAAFSALAAIAKVHFLVDDITVSIKFNLQFNTSMLILTVLL